MYLYIRQNETCCDFYKVITLITSIIFESGIKNNVQHSKSCISISELYTMYILLSWGKKLKELVHKALSKIPYISACCNLTKCMLVYN